LAELTIEVEVYRISHDLLQWEVSLQWCMVVGYNPARLICIMAIK